MAGLDALPSEPFKENTGAGCHGAMSEMSILRYSMYGIFTYIYHTFKINIPYMEHMGSDINMIFSDKSNLGWFSEEHTDY